MRITTILPPLLACIATGWLLLDQRGEIQRKENRRQALDSTLSQAQAKENTERPATVSTSSKSRENSVASAPTIATTAGPPAKVALQDLIASADSQHGMPDFKAMVKLQAAFDGMTVQDIGALLAEANGANLENAKKIHIENQLLEAMAEKDPKLALEAGDILLVSSDQDSGMRRFHLRGAFEKWAAKSSSEAAAWLDAKIASGQLDSKSLTGGNQERIHYESALIARQMQENPDLAQKRVGELTAEERKSVFQQTWGFPITPEGRQQYVSLVRSALAPEQQVDALRNYASQLSTRGKLEDVSEFLTLATPSEEESRAIVGQAAADNLQRKVAGEKSAEELTSDAAVKWRDWVVKSAPNDASAIIGKSIGEMHGLKATAEQLETAFQKLSPPGTADAVKVAYLQGTIRNATMARQVAESITDAGLREQAIKNLTDKSKP